MIFRNKNQEKRNKTMKKYILLINCFIFLLSCKQKPSYNPFDNQFNIDESYFIKDGLDTIWDTCGYYGVVKINNHSKMSYVYQYDNLIGKYYHFYIDTINVKEKIIYDSNNYDSLNSLPLNKISLNKSLKKFNYKFYKQKGKIVYIINNNSKKIDTTYIDSDVYTDSLFISRKLSFSKKKKSWY